MLLRSSVPFSLLSHCGPGGLAIGVNKGSDPGEGGDWIEIILLRQCSGFIRDILGKHRWLQHY
jgi:hypothetical protein